ncbi:MAG: Gfo/Idh/MocA family oxidoreductase [Armatimonadetes bacterium]|nr:Gfo/Idh/MocA family oxidoreductase [Armatimonadota bacterium]
MKQPLTAAVIGLGNISRVHLKALAAIEDIRLAAVVDVDRQRVEAAAREYGAEPYSELTAMLEAVHPDYAVVCVPHGLHEATTIETLRAGAHVLVEKPMANNRHQCDAMMAAAQAAQRQIMVGYTWHYRAALRETRRRLEAAGEPVLFGVTELSYDFPKPERPGWFFDVGLGGGSLLANGCHAIDWLRFGIGERAERVQAMVLNRPEGLAVDSLATAQIRFASGAVGQMICWGLKTVGSRTRFEFRTEHHALAWGAEGLTHWHDGEAEPVALEQGEDPFITEHREFVTAIRTGREPAIRAAYGREINAIGDAMRESSAQGCEIEVDHG